MTKSNVPTLYCKVELVTSLRAKTGSTMHILNENCFQYMTSFLLDREIIEGPEPAIVTTSESIRITKNGRNIEVTTYEWEAFEAYVQTSPNWSNHMWLAYQLHRYYIIYDPNNE